MHRLVQRAGIVSQARSDPVNRCAPSRGEHCMLAKITLRTVTRCHERLSLWTNDSSKYLRRRAAGRRDVPSCAALPECWARWVLSRSPDRRIPQPDDAGAGAGGTSAGGPANARRRSTPARRHAARTIGAATRRSRTGPFAATAWSARTVRVSAPMACARYK